MEDFLQSQIRDSCRLALPEGLRDLMSDISREVLRVQPPDLYNFIAEYLEALLLARETLCIACRVCHDICNCACHPELDEELRNLGLDGEDLEVAKNVVMEYFEKDEVKEGNLLMKLFGKTNFDPNLLPDIQDAVREAFQKHMRVRKAKYWAEAEKANYVVQRAAKHTLEFHERAQTDKELSLNGAATKIQAAFRGALERKGLDEVALKLRGKLAQIESSNMILQPPAKVQNDAERPCTSKQARNSIVRISLSSTSLAGSLVNLPIYVPYSVHDMSYADFEERETERTNIDYTLETFKTPKDSKKDEGSKKIAFFEQHVLHEIKSCSIVEEEIEEHIEDDNSEANSVNENITEDENFDNINEHLENAHDEGVVDSQPFAKVGVKKSGFGIDILISYDDDITNINENNFSKAAANENEIIEVKESQSHQIKEAFAGQTSFYEHYEDKSVREGSSEEQMENKECLPMKESLSDKAGSKANIELLKSLRKNSIRLSESGVTDDREGDHSSSNY